MAESTGHYDAVVFGSGIGGMSATSLLSHMEHKRIMILERHFRISGFTHTFGRKGKYEWDVGLHDVRSALARLPRAAELDCASHGVQ